MFDKILVCLDGSKLAEQVLSLVAENFAPLKSQVVLLTVANSEITLAPPQSMHIPPLGGRIDPRKVPLSDVAGEFGKEAEAGGQLAAIEQEQAKIKDYLEALAVPLRHRGLKVSTLILSGEPAKTILHWAEKHRVALIALTSHGQSGLEAGGYERNAPKVLKAGLGRVAQQVLKDSQIPALVIKPSVA
jgi:nucleotide-binding universal stress UspA family protein